MRLVCRNSLMQKAIAIGIAALYLATTLGTLPSPPQLVRWLTNATTSRYPCESCGCGCASADECWTACCCHSQQERLIWSLREGVEPPHHLEVSDEDWIAAANALNPGSAHCGLCVIALKARLKAGLPIDEPMLDPAPVSASQTCCGSSQADSCCDSSKPDSRPAFTAATCKRLFPLMIAPIPSITGAAGLQIVVPPPASRQTPPRAVADAWMPAPAIDPPTPPPRVLA